MRRCRETAKSFSALSSRSRSPQSPLAWRRSKPEMSHPSRVSASIAPGVATIRPIEKRALRVSVMASALHPVVAFAIFGLRPSAFHEERPDVAHEFQIPACECPLVPVKPVEENVGNLVRHVFPASSCVEPEFVARAAPAYLVAPVAFLLVRERPRRDVIKAKAILGERA